MAAAAAKEQTGTLMDGILIEELGKQLPKQTAAMQTAAMLDLPHVTETVVGFVHAVSWTEPWLMCLIVFHTSLLVLSIVSRKHSNLQMGLFFLVLLGVFSTERLNSFLQRHWRRFAYRPYFDSHGMFLSAVWSGPLLVVSSLILVNSLITFSTLVHKWKRAELKHRIHTAQEKID
jgi:hypothetical protein